jgi:uncharacterized protein YkwD
MDARYLVGALLVAAVGCGDFDLPHRRGSSRSPTLTADAGHRIIINGGEDDPGNPSDPSDPSNPSNPSNPGKYDSGVPKPKPDSGVPVPPPTKPDMKQPPPVAPDSGQPAPGSCGTQFETELFGLVNKERQKAGKQPFLCDLATVKVAHDYSQVMCDKNHFSHTGPDGSSPFQRMQKGGIKFSTAGENIAAGQRSPTEVMQSWMGSSGHRANILGNYKYYGGGHSPCPNGGQWGGNYWTQNFWSP